MEPFPTSFLALRDLFFTVTSLGFPCGSAGSESACSAEDLGSMSGLGRPHPLHYSDLENPMDCIVHGVAKSRTRLSDCHFHTSLGFVFSCHLNQKTTYLQRKYFSSPKAIVSHKLINKCLTLKLDFHGRTSMGQGIVFFFYVVN